MEAPSPLHCDFEPTAEVNSEGWRKHRCVNCEYVSVFIPPWSQRIVRECYVGPDGGKPLPVGTELAALLAELEITEKESCGCAAKARQMDLWGEVGCNRHRDLIVGWLSENYHSAGWLESIRAAWRGMFKVNPFDPFGSLLDESIARAKAQAAQSAPPR